MNEQVIDEISKWQLMEFIPSLQSEMKSGTENIYNIKLDGTIMTVSDFNKKTITRHLTETQRHYVECLLKVNAQHKNDAETR